MYKIYFRVTYLFLIALLGFSCKISTEDFEADTEAAFTEVTINQSNPDGTIDWILYSSEAKYDELNELLHGRNSVIDFFHDGKKDMSINAERVTKDGDSQIIILEGNPTLHKYFY